MPSYMEKRLDRSIEEYAQICLSERKETITKINELQQLKKEMQYCDSTAIKNTQDRFDNLIAKDYKILGETNLRIANELNKIAYAKTNYRLEKLKAYLGESTFSSLFYFCNTDPDTTLEFVGEAIFSLLSEEKISKFHQNKSEQTKKNDDQFKVFSERQLNLRELMDSKLFKTLDFIFCGDWNEIDKFCSNSIKIQIPSETPEVYQLCEEDLPF